MKKENIPYYNDPCDFEEGENKFPCNTQYMKYNPLLHRYYLTEEGLLHYGINAQRKYISDNPNKVAELIEKISKKVYDYIFYKAGANCYQIQMYRIATAPATIYPSQYLMRKQFEEALVAQARRLTGSGDTVEYARVDLEKEEKSANEDSTNVRDTSDMSPECVRTLDTLGLTKWFRIGGPVYLDKNKY